MKTDFSIHDYAIEAERYELADAPTWNFDLDRREFFKTLGCGILVLLFVDAVSAQETGGGRRRAGRGGQRPAEISAWIHIGEDGTVTGFTGKAEVGQNIRTSLSQAVAEELRVPFASVKMVMADTSLVPFDAGTFGSRTTPDMFPQLRHMAAAAREALLDLAAESLKADRATLSAADGRISSSSGGSSVSYADLTKGKQLVKSANENPGLTPASDWKVAGASVLKAEGRSFVTGTHQYASDVRLPGMLHGKVLRPPKITDKLASVDTSEAESMPGVKVVRDGDFVGAVGPDILIATRAVESMHAKWNSKPEISVEELYAHLKSTSRGGPTKGEAPKDTATTNNGSTGHTIERTYNIAYIAHAPLEPRAAVARWKDDQLTVWTGTQRPFGIKGDIAQALGIPDSNIRIIVPDTGSGYGGKHTNDAAIEAARLAKAAGKPVKLVWTRNEEFTRAYFRPAGVIDVSASVGDDGILTSWDFHNYNSGGSGIRSPYDVPHQRSESHSSSYPLKQGSYRGLAATANHFARESHMDDLARALKMDRVEFRLKNLKDERLRAVLQAAAKAFGWGSSKPSVGHGYGIAAGTEKGSCLATAVEVAADASTGSVKVLRAVSAFECGAVVNPEHLKNQVEGALVMGVGGALFEAIEFEEGKITNGHFADYRVPRFADAPEIEVVLVNRPDITSLGAGETPIVCIAPAIGNAICDATGVRLSSMPMKLGKT